MKENLIVVFKYSVLFFVISGDNDNEVTNDQDEQVTIGKRFIPYFQFSIYKKF